MSERAPMDPTENIFDRTQAPQNSMLKTYSYHICDLIPTGGLHVRSALCALPHLGQHPDPERAPQPLLLLQHHPRYWIQNLLTFDVSVWLLVYRVRRLPRHDCRVRRRIHDRHRVRLRLRRLPQKLEERASSGILMFFMVRMNVLRQVGQAEISLERRAPLRVQIFVHIFFDEMLKSSTVMQCHLGWWWTDL